MEELLKTDLAVAVVVEQVHDVVEDVLVLVADDLEYLLRVDEATGVLVQHAEGLLNLVDVVGLGLVVYHGRQELGLLDLSVAVNVDGLDQFQDFGFVADAHLAHAQDHLLLLEDAVPVLVQLVEVLFEVLDLLVVVGDHGHLGLHDFLELVEFGLLLDLLQLVLQFVLLLVEQQPLVVQDFGTFEALGRVYVQNA